MKIKLYRIILNVLFYVFYVILTSVSFSFIFPTILVILWQDIIAPNNPIFDWIQIIIIILVLFLSLIFRKIFYLPIKEEAKKIDSKKVKEFKEYKKKEKIKESNNDELELDIKIGKEIK